MIYYHCLFLEMFFFLDIWNFYNVKINKGINQKNAKKRIWSSVPHHDKWRCTGHVTINYITHNPSARIRRTQSEVLTSRCRRRRGRKIPLEMECGTIMSSRSDRYTIMHIITLVKLFSPEQFFCSVIIYLLSVAVSWFCYPTTLTHISSKQGEYIQFPLFLW